MTKDITWAEVVSNFVLVYKNLVRSHLDNCNCVWNPYRKTDIETLDKRRKRTIQHPPQLPDINRVSSIKILRVTVSDSLSVCEHVNNVITSCAQSVQAMRILRAHGMATSAIHAWAQPLGGRGGSGPPKNLDGPPTFYIVF